MTGQAVELLTYLLVNLLTSQLVKPCKLSISLTCLTVNSLTYQLVNPSICQLINLSTPKPTNSQMDKLKTRILQDGKCYEGGILKVDSFINHQMDPNLMMEVAKEFSRHFADAHINKIVTIEASGIAPAILVGYIMQLPVVFIKKKQPKTMDNMLTSVVHSFTKDRSYTVCISADYLTPQDHVLFIDDFLANGNASMGVIDLCKQAGARLEGMGFIIEKAFQKGGDALRQLGIRYKALATVESLDNCKIKLRD